MAEVATELGLQGSESEDDDRTAAAAAVVVAPVAENEEVSAPDVSASCILRCTSGILQ